MVSAPDPTMGNAARGSMPVEAEKDQARFIAADAERHERAQDEVDDEPNCRTESVGRSRDAGCCPLEILMGENDS